MDEPKHIHLYRDFFIDLKSDINDVDLSGYVTKTEYSAKITEIVPVYVACGGKEENNKEVN